MNHYGYRVNKHTLLSLQNFTLIKTLSFCHSLILATTWLHNVQVGFEALMRSCGEADNQGLTWRSELNKNQRRGANRVLWFPTHLRTSVCVRDGQCIDQQRSYSLNGDAGNRFMVEIFTLFHPRRSPSISTLQLPLFLSISTAIPSRFDGFEFLVWTSSYRSQHRPESNQTAE